VPSRQVKFLSGTRILAHVSAALKSSGSADIAVAFWGTGAASILGLAELPGPSESSVMHGVGLEIPANSDSSVNWRSRYARSYAFTRRFSSHRI